jgi:hypothetical protein
VVKTEQTPSGSDEQNGQVLFRRHADLDALRLPPSPAAPHNQSPLPASTQLGALRQREAAMASNSSPNELREHARIFSRWAHETGSPEMREAFLSMANGITHRLLCREKPCIGVVLRNFEISEHGRAGAGLPRRGRASVSRKKGNRFEEERQGFV